MNVSEYLGLWEKWWYECAANLSTGTYPDFPRVVQFQTSTRCNGQCLFCPHPQQVASGKLPDGQMPDALLQRLIDELVASPEVSLIVPSLQSEPLLDSRVLRAISDMKDRAPEKAVHLVTNGSCLSENVIDYLLECGLDILDVSLSACTAETYRALNPALDFDAICNMVRIAIRKAHERNVETAVFVRFVVSSVNEHELDEFRSYWESAGAEVFAFPVTNRRGAVENFASLQIKGGPLKGSLSASSESPACFCPFLTAHVLCDGGVLACCHDWERAMVIGDLEHETLRDAFQGTAMRRIQQVMWENGYKGVQTCRDCSFPGSVYSTATAINATDG